MKEKTIENAWSILLKFGKEENLQKLQAGQFYMKNLQYYVDLEKGTSDEDVGDMYDGQMMLQDVKTLLANNIGYSRDFVSYYGFNNVDHLKQIQKDNLRIAFWKRQKYEYQQEYRLVAHTEVDDYLCVEIGDISDITEIMKTKQLLNTYLEVTFSVKPME